MADVIGLGLALAYESATPGTYTGIGGLKDFTGPELSVDTIDVTNHGHTDGYRRFIGGLIDGGEVSAVVAFDPSLTVYGALKTIAETRAPKNWQVTYPGGAKTTFSGILTSVGRETPLDEQMTCAIQIKVSGAPVEAAS